MLDSASFIGSKSGAAALGLPVAQGEEDDSLLGQ